MKRKKDELDVDVIGGLGPLTKGEEKAISNYLKNKNRRINRQGRKKSISPRRKTTVA